MPVKRSQLQRVRAALTLILHTARRADKPVVSYKAGGGLYSNPGPVCVLGGIEQLLSRTKRNALKLTTEQSNALEAGFEGWGGGREPRSYYRLGVQFAKRAKRAFPHAWGL